jgi:hypothetical protein
MNDLNKYIDISKVKEILNLGFTGTRKGMSDKQKMQLVGYFALAKEFGKIVHFHEGDCVGADDEATEIARNMGFKIEIHPPEKDTTRSFNFVDGDIIHKKYGYIQRDKHIVNSSLLLFAAPKDHRKREIRSRSRSGTWTTVRYAEGQRTPVILLERY